MLPTSASARDQYILDSVAAHGDNVAYTWVEVQVPTDDGTDLRISVFEDALMVDGVRVGMSARVSQQVADMVGGILCTPKMADIIYAARQRTAVPHPQPISNSTDTMIAHSKAITADLAKSGGGGLASTVGKFWCLSNRNTASLCINYGWHVMATGSWGGIAVKPCVSLLPGVSVIQPAQLAHNYDHSDYSQTLVLAHADCMVNGSPRRLADVMQDPRLAKFISHEGPLSATRLPVGEASFTGDFGRRSVGGAGGKGAVVLLALMAFAAGWYLADELAA